MSARVVRGKCGCHTSNQRQKTWYRNKNAARAARDTSTQRSVKEGAPRPSLRIYPCPTTHGWHLTGNQPRPHRTATPPAEDHAA